MIIQKIGAYGFKISAGDTVLAVNPPSSSARMEKVSKFGADAVLISVEHPDWNGEETATLGGKEPFVIRGPGAYEVGPAVIHGYHTEGALVGETSPYANTAYIVDFDGMTLLILGALSGKLPQDLREDLDELDIVFTPVGGATLEPKKAHEIVVSLEPKLIIPYAVGDSSELDVFFKTEGAKEVTPVEKLTLRAKEVAEMSGVICFLA